MSILKSMNTGVSGLRANGQAMGVIGDNIANVNTVGFKAGRANFSDVMGNLMLGIGDGTRVGDVQQLFEQGALEMTGQTTDMAIAGQGFFVVRNPGGDAADEFYTRAGQFVLDDQGFITTPAGFRLQGYPADDAGTLRTTTIGDLQVGDRTSPPAATTSVDLALNLNPNEAVIVDPWDPNDPTATSNYATSVTVYDSLGNAIQAEVYYRKVDENQWEYHVMVDGEQLEGGTPGELTEISSGTLDFDVDGVLVDHVQGPTTFNPVGAAAGQELELNFDGSTQHAGDSTLRRLRQDGYAAGDIRGIQIEADGTIMGVFSNGEEMAVGQVVLAQFDAPEGLQRQGGNLWARTPDSGDPRMDAAGVGGRGSIVSGALESSNVDLSHEFVKMIAAQRGYQASSKTVSTGDQMLQEVMNLKR